MHCAKFRILEKLDKRPVYHEFLQRMPGNSNGAKKPQKRHNSSSIVVGIKGKFPQATHKILKTTIQRCGGTFTNDVQKRATHVVLDRNWMFEKDGVKMFQNVKNLMRVEWLLESARSKTFANTAKYKWRLQTTHVDSVLGGIDLGPNMLKFVDILVEEYRSKLTNVKPVRGVTVRSPGRFVVNNRPDIVFTFENEGRDIQKQWEYVQRAVEVCKKEQLYLLVLPQQSLFERPDGSLLIAERCLPFPHDWLRQQQIYYSGDESLTPALKQLTTFIFQTGFMDIKLENIPVLDHESHPPGQPKRIALLDLAACGSPFSGLKDCGMSLESDYTLRTAFFGNFFSRGLFTWIPKAQFQSIFEAGLENGLDIEDVYSVDLRPISEKHDRDNKQREDFQN